MGRTLGFAYPLLLRMMTRNNGPPTFTNYYKTPLKLYPYYFLIWGNSKIKFKSMEVRYVGNEPSPSHSTKKPTPSSCAVDSSSVSQRLQKELMALMMSGDKGVSAFPEGENIFSWIGTIVGGKETPYDGLSYKLSLKFPLEYPFKPPFVKFETPCFHPNVDQYGNICLDILQNMWSSAYDCRAVLLSIQSLLGEPNVDSPLNCYAATLWSSQEEYKKMVHKQYVDGNAASVAKP